MKIIKLWVIIKLVYKEILRPLLVEAIENPEKEWDDWVLKFLDSIFEYDGS